MDERLRFVARLLEGEKMASRGPRVVIEAATRVRLIDGLDLAFVEAVRLRMRGHLAGPQATAPSRRIAAASRAA